MRFLLVLFASNLIILSERSVLAQAQVDFNTQIRPILSENCFHCHGPDAEQREAELRLDEHNGALSAIEPTDRSASELFKRVTSKDEFEVMPPPDSNRNLTDEQIELLGQWIDQGAEWGEHWSWTPIVTSQTPTEPAFDQLPVRNPIDAFVQVMLIRKGLSPSPEADKHTLIRRVTLDLTGLPPTPEEVQNFLVDDSPNAYEKVVDRLLASPAYGERMAWNWLDAARYADSNGYQGDRERTMWPWRDWVVEAFNKNLPYDKFTVWQLAGDLLPDATFEQKLATGFCRNHMINGEGGRIAEENRVDYVMDMAETTGTLWLGLTFNCCRCHDHKFDALSQEDYYSLFAFFNQTPVTGGGGDPQTAPVIAAPTATQKKQISDQEGLLKDAKQKLVKRAKELNSKQSKWEQEQLAKLDDVQSWEMLAATELSATHQQLEQSEDGVIFASGDNPDNDTYVIVTEPTLKTITGLRLDALRHNSHTDRGFARSNSGNFVLTEVEVTLINNDETKEILIASAQATYEQGQLKIENTFDGKSGSGWAVLGSKPIHEVDHAAVFQFKNPVELTLGSKLEITLRHDSVHKSHNLGRFTISMTDDATPTLESSDPLSLARALTTPVTGRSQEQRKLLVDKHLAEDPQYTSIRKEFEPIEKRLKSLRGQIPKVMVMEDIQQPRDSFILTRGLYTAPTEKVSANVPASLPPLTENSTYNRLDLANWLVADENPLTARVVVNQFWQQLFGIGIVKTSNDFGVQGEIPVHKDLLNWLAADFRYSGWDVKRLMKRMVMSHTYRQSSKVTPELIGKDPENRLLARAPRHRLPSWMLRDQALAVSGLLNSEQGGPSVNVYQPPGVWEEATFGKKKYTQDHGDALYRRSMYIFWRRIVGPTVFFDNASRQSCSVNTYLTNTPLHALQTLNDTTYVEAARVLAEKALLVEDIPDEDRLNWIAQRAIARDFKPAEAKILLAGLDRSQNKFDSNREHAKKLLSIGEFPRNESLNITHHAAWTTLCLAILNLDETLTKE